jgi:hypothetical protein
VAVGIAEAARAWFETVDRTRSTTVSCWSQCVFTNRGSDTPGDDRPNRCAAGAAEVMIIGIVLVVVSALAYWWAWKVVFPPKR